MRMASSGEILRFAQDDKDRDTFQHEFVLSE